jgi:hypothetical protein
MVSEGVVPCGGILLDLQESGSIGEQIAWRGRQFHNLGNFLHNMEISHASRYNQQKIPNNLKDNVRILKDKVFLKSSAQPRTVTMSTS